MMAITTDRRSAVADQAVRDGGGTVVHAGPLTNQARYRNRRLVPAEGFKRLLPPLAPRAGVAALMLDEAKEPQFAGGTAVALFG